MFAETDPAGWGLSMLGRLDVMGWVLIGAALAIVYLTWRGSVGRTRLGTIDVQPITADADTKFTVVAATAELQRELARSGLRPPGGVPAGSPTTKLVAAVENAPLDQAKWLAALIGLLPVPPKSVSFTVSSTLRKGCASHVDCCAVTYKIVDSGTGRCVKLDTECGGAAMAAIHAAANAIYREICEHASGAVPVWARWANAEALVRYRKGIECEDLPGKGVEPRYAAAAEHFLAASELDPDNMLVRLRHGNCLERLAGCLTLDDPNRIGRWIEALYVYAAVRTRHPTIFESRFRMSVILSLVADHLDEQDKSAVDALRALLRMLDPTADGVAVGDVDALRTRLQGAAKHESKAAWRRLRLSWTLLNEHRFRHEFEPTGKDRRQLRKALTMSYMCLRLRRHWHPAPGDPDVDVKQIPWGLGAVPRVFWRFLVDWRYMRLRWATAGWQAHYNAAAFYALLPEASVYKDPTLPSQRLRAQAFKHLIRAIGDPDNELRPAYVRDEDADLRVLREIEKHALTNSDLEAPQQWFPLRKRAALQEASRWRDIVRLLVGPEAILHYHRPEGDSRVWRAEVSGSAIAHANGRLGRPVEAMITDDFGAVFRIPLHDGSKLLKIRMINGKDYDCERPEFIVAQYPVPEVWVVADKTPVYPTRAEAEAEAGAA